jgi:hypothetical protein
MIILMILVNIKKMIYEIFLNFCANIRNEIIIYSIIL